MILVKDSHSLNVGVVGPIPEGETPEQTVERLEKIFNFKASKYAYVIHDEPMVGEIDKQMYPVIIGTVWTEKE